MRKRSEVKEREERGPRYKGIAAAAKAFDAFRPAREVLSIVRAVPTRFVQFDHATRVKGLPIERFGLIHGPSGEGKTYFSLGLLESFLRLDHFGLLIDAERTTPISWARGVMGPRADHPGFFAIRPKSYEETVKQVREFVITLKRQRDEGVIPPDTSALIICDSIRKLVPEGLLAKLFGEVYEGVNARRKKQIDRGAKGIDGVGGRAAQIKAAMNAQWLDELTPLLEETHTGFLAIAREAEDPEADHYSKLAGTAYKVGGGTAIYYDSSIVIRIERSSWVSDGGDDDGKNKKIFGEKHAVTIRKTKVAGQEQKQTVCYFHTSNGTLIPVGFDRARDVIDIGVRFKIVEQSGAWFSFRGQRLGQGIHNSVKALADNEALLDEVELAVRESFPTYEPTEVTEQGEVT